MNSNILRYFLRASSVIEGGETSEIQIILNITNKCLPSKEEERSLSYLLGSPSKTFNIPEISPFCLSLKSVPLLLKPFITLKNTHQLFMKSLISEDFLGTYSFYISHLNIAFTIYANTSHN